MPADGIITLTPEQEEAAKRIDGLDLEPIAYKLIHPEPGETGMTLAAADQAVAAYRCFLKLSAWYPEESVVPSRAIDEVWHTHILDTAKYAEDSETVFGYFLHHFPYFGMRGDADEEALHAAYARTCGLLQEHFGAGPLDAAAGASDCDHRFGNAGGSGGKGSVPPPAGADLASGRFCTECSTEGEGKCISCTRAPRSRPRPDRGAAARV
jgi:hypothetical protein